MSSEFIYVSMIRKIHVGTIYTHIHLPQWERRKIMFVYLCYVYIYDYLNGEGKYGEAS